jgi:hypothetical protein
VTAPPTLHGKHALLLGLALMGAIPYGLPAAGSLLAGGSIQIVNLKLLEAGVRRLLGLAGHSPGGFGMAMQLARFFLLGAVVVAVLVQEGIQPLAFMVGLLLSLPAAAWQGLQQARRGS